jgi:hypothetical protein
MRETFLKLLIGSLCLLALVAMAGIAGGDFNDTTGRIVSNVSAVAIYSLCGFCGAALLDKRPDHLLAKATIAAAAIGFLFSTTLIWGDWNGDSDALVRGMFLFLILALSGAHASLLVSRLRETDGDAVRLVTGGTLLAMSVVCLMLVYVALSVDGDAPGEGFWRLLGVVAVVDLLGTLVAPILRKLESQQCRR